MPNFKQAQALTYFYDKLLDTNGPNPRAPNGDDANYIFYETITLLNDPHVVVGTRPNKLGQTKEQADKLRKLANDLADCFLFSATSEGGVFWGNIHNRPLDMADEIRTNLEPKFRPGQRVIVTLTHHVPFKWMVIRVDPNRPHAVAVIADESDTLRWFHPTYVRLDA